MRVLVQSDPFDAAAPARDLTQAPADVAQAEVTRLVDRAATTLKFRPVLRFEGPVRSLVSARVAPDLLAVGAFLVAVGTGLALSFPQTTQRLLYRVTNATPQPPPT